MPTSRPILIVEDDLALRATLAERLAAEGGFLAAEAGSAAEAHAKLGKPGARFDLVLLDIGLPDGDGRELCHRLRRDGRRMPIIMLTGGREELGVVRGLEAGANDYMAKPCRMPELLARMRAQLRSFDASPDAPLNVGPYLFLPAARVLLETGRNRKVQLTDKEVRILRRLYQAEGQAIRRKVLLDEVWGYSGGVDTHTLETHIYRLRQKMEPDPRKPRLLLTAPDNGGYCLQADPDLEPAQNLSGDTAKG